VKIRRFFVYSFNKRKMSIFQSSLVPRDASFSNLVVQNNSVVGKDLYINGTTINIQNVSARVVSPSILLVKETSLGDFVNNIPINVGDFIDLTVDKFKMQSPFVFDATLNALQVRNEFVGTNLLGVTDLEDSNRIDSGSSSFILNGRRNVISVTGTRCDGNQSVGNCGIVTASNSTITGNGQFCLVASGQEHFMDGGCSSAILGGFNHRCEGNSNRVAMLGGRDGTMDSCGNTLMGTGQNLSCLNNTNSCNLCGLNNAMQGANQACIVNGTDNFIGNNGANSLAGGVRGRALNERCVVFGFNADSDTESSGSSQFVIGFDPLIASRGMYWVNHPTGTGTQLSITGTGRLVEETSSLKYKTNVQPLTFESASSVLKSIESMTYQRTDNGVQDVGFVAEEMAKVFPEAVVFDENNEARSVRLGPVVSVILKVLQEMLDV
jgi:hypothetical protein